MSDIRTFQCPNCGSPVHASGADKEVKCDYCGSTVVVPKELRDDPQPQPQSEPAQFNFGGSSNGSDQVMQTLENVGKVTAGATLGFTAVSVIVPIAITCVILVMVGGILYSVFSGINSSQQGLNQAQNQLSQAQNQLSGAGVAAATDVPTPTPIDTPVPFKKILFKDDFSSTSGKWPVTHSSKYTLEYKGSQYHILINDPGQGEEVTPNNNNSFGTVSVEADFQETSGPNDGLMGVTCRDNNNGDFYSFEFSQDGTYGIYKYSNGSSDALDEETLNPNTINQGDVNHLEGVCEGDTLTLILNGQVLVQVQDSSLTKGSVGLIVRTGNSGQDGVDALIDNFVARGQ
jgi:DNA-directed RNA polymerase subunit RPC12/RpoP